MSNIAVSKKRLMTAAVGTEPTAAIVSEAIQLHQSRLKPKYVTMEDMYMGRYKELELIQKPNNKPNNKLVMNYAKYIVDTFSGYHMGVPVVISHDDERVNEYIKEYRNVNDMHDNEFELGKIMDIYGHGFLYVYQDEDGITRTTYNTPVNMFIVHDNSVSEKQLFAVRYVYDMDNATGYGELLTADKIVELKVSLGGQVEFMEERPNIYGKLPVIEAIENEERQGVFENVVSLINALNKAVSEKANDVDYFADAYLKIIGHELDEEVAKNIKDNRIINLWGEGNLDADFLDKPNADTTQENLIRTLKEHISKLSMVADLSDEDFGNSSGTALAYKLQAMDNLAKTKDRKMQSAFNRLYEVVFSVPLSNISADAYQDIHYTFTRNVPRNILEETQIVAQLDGQVSDETKLSVLSIVADPQAEIEKMTEDEERQSKLARQIEINNRRKDSELAQGDGADEQVESGLLA